MPSKKIKTLSMHERAERFQREFRTLSDKYDLDYKADVQAKNKFIAYLVEKMFKWNLLRVRLWIVKPQKRNA